jgi:hypothetical protein
MYSCRIFHGVLQVITSGGTRYLEANFFERLYLMWTFRNFPILPHTVLNRRQRQLLDKLLVRRRSGTAANEIVDRPVIGTVERYEHRAGVFGVEHALPNSCSRPVSWGPRRG